MYLRPRRIVRTNTGARKNEGRALCKGPASLARSRSVALLGLRDRWGRWGVLGVFPVLAVMLVLKCAVVGGACIDGVVAVSAGVLVGRVGASTVVRYDDDVVAGATVYGVVAATAEDSVIV